MQSIGNEKREPSHLLLAALVEIDAADLAAHLVEADVIEPLEAGADDGPDAVVGNEEVLLPAHEYVLALGDVLDEHLAALAGLLGEGTERGELGPV